MDEGKDKKTGTAVTVLLVIVACSLVPWSFLAFLSLFAFDAPGSENQLSSWLLAGPVWAYPVIAAACIFGSIILKRKNKLRPALIVIAVPLAAIVVWTIFIGLYFSLPSR
ncbi:MAG: hypothetical protein NT177_05030 [Chloroflexi bacterium]|nr:hypothetical protein [Chloroflexota bacterium]